MSLYFLSLGSNIRPRFYLPKAIRELRKISRVVKISSIYQTPPFGPANGSKFLNGVLALESKWNWQRLDREIRKIEKKLGRKRDPKDKFAPRTIDLDLLPYPGFEKHPFVILPLAEIAALMKIRAAVQSMEALAKKFRKELRSYKKVRLRMGTY